MGVLYHRAAGFVRSCTRVACASALVSTVAPRWTKRRTNPESMTEILVRHGEARAKAEAQATNIRQQATKMPKKQKNTALAKAQKIVDDVIHRHEVELEELGVDPNGEEVVDLLNSLVERINVAGAESMERKEAAAAEGNVHERPEESAEDCVRKNRQRRSKVQRRHNAVQEQQQQCTDGTDTDEAQTDAAAMTGESAKELEDRAMAEILSLAGLAVHPIKADGNCLFRSIEHQLTMISGGGAEPVPDYTAMRKLCADTLRSHPDDYLPFVASDGMATVASFHQYCDTLATTAEWGGELEVQALSRALGVEIIVFQASTAPITFGKGNANGQIRLSYHQHSYHLGAHYNSLITRDTSNASAASALCPKLSQAA